MLKEVNGKSHYRQFLRLAGRKVILATPNFTADGLSIRDNGQNKAILIPTEGNLRAQLNVLEHFVCSNVTLPSGLKRPEDQKVQLYKALWQQDNMYVSVSPWCEYYQFNPELNAYTRMSEQGPFGKGSYHMTVEVPYVYIGEHKGGHLFSLTLRITQVVFQPATAELDVDALFNSAIDALTEEKTSIPKGKKSKAKKATALSTLPVKPTINSA